MPKPIVMPQVGQDLTEGLLVQWNVKAGDAVKKGDVLALVESEKASFEVESYEEGTVIELLYAEGDNATVLEPILFLAEAGEAAEKTGGGPAPAAATSPAAASAPNVTEKLVTNIQASTAGTAKSTSSSPLARRIAMQKGLDIASIQGTGPRGSVVKRDVEAAAQTLAGSSPSAPLKPAAVSTPLPAATSADDVEQPFSKMRQIIADRLLLSKQTIPHFYLMAEADITDLQIRRKAHTEITGEKISLNDVIVHAAALTLLEFPDLNAFVSNTGVLKKGQVNIGVAVSVKDGLMVPALEDTPGKSVAEISELIGEYAAAARRGINKSQAKSTFSISNLGMYGVEVLPIINPPEAGILGVGPIKRQVKEHRGGLQGRDIISLSLAADHRAVDGVYGAQFLKALCETIETYKELS